MQIEWRMARSSDQCPLEEWVIPRVGCYVPQHVCPVPCCARHKRKRARYQDLLGIVFEVVAVETSGVIGHETITVLGDVSLQVCVAISDLMSTPISSREWRCLCNGRSSMAAVLGIRS